MTFCVTVIKKMNTHSRFSFSEFIDRNAALFSEWCENSINLTIPSENSLRKYYKSVFDVKSKHACMAQYKCLHYWSPPWKIIDDHKSS